ncbi:MAG: TdeIII family type II restriction endonuclease, partial [Endomicrobia bacterium]|nr:TdeIII family type II restriction endonuclease [Endomicrobiia bacterium]
FDYCETLLASELWNLLSGENNTMEEILQIINAISTPEFQSKFQFLRNSENRTSDTYITRLQEWNLFSEIELVSNSGSLRQNRNQARVYDKLSFKSDGEYNWERYNTLKRILG